MRYVLKEMTIGEVLDVAINIVRDHFKALFSITLYLLVPAFIIYQFAIFYTIGDPPGMFASQAEQQAFVQNLQTKIIPYLVINGLFFVGLGLIIWPITNAAIIRAVAGAYLGQPITGGAAMREGLGRLLPLLGVAFVVGLVSGLGFLLLIIPGIYLMSRLFLSTYSVVIEGTGVGGAMSRSWELMNGNMLNGIVLGIVVTFATSMIGSMANLIPEPYIRAVIVGLIQSVAMIGTAATGVVFYFSCRCKHENFDLSVLANAVGQEPPPPDAATVPQDGGTTPANPGGGFGGPAA